MIPFKYSVLPFPPFYFLFISYVTPSDSFVKVGGTKHDMYIFFHVLVHYQLYLSWSSHFFGPCLVEP
jgi:hypothetical protein